MPRPYSRTKPQSILYEPTPLASQSTREPLIPKQDDYTIRVMWFQLPRFVQGNRKVVWATFARHVIASVAKQSPMPGVEIASSRGSSQ